jgi:murein DD-endopeptidase MepM/ murein hydrolase activator NlpD
MPLYTMSGKRTTIAERDSTSEEERIAEIKARLFTLFDEEDEKEREYEEQNRLKNRATGAFWKIKNIIGDSDETYDEEPSSHEPSPSVHRPRQERHGGKTQMTESPEDEAPVRQRIEQERRVKPVNPVRARDAESRIDEPRIVEARRAEPQRTETRKTGPRRTEARKAEPRRVETSTAKASKAPRKKEPVDAGFEYTRPDISERQDASFRLGDLFKEKEPDIFSMWEQEDEDAKRIRERRERRRAEAAKRVHGEDDGSKMKTAAAIFIAREGMRNIFGKFSGSLVRDTEREDEEREAERALRELADARSDTSGEAESKKRASFNYGPENEPDEKIETPMKPRKKRGEKAMPSEPVREDDSLFGSFKYPVRLSRTAIAWIAGGAAGAIAVIIIAFAIVNSHAVGVSVGGAELGYVEDKASFVALVADVKAEIAEANDGADIVINDGKIALADAVRSGDKTDTIKADELKDVLLKADAVKVSGYAINVNGAPLVNLPTKDEAQAVLDGIAGKYINADGAEYEWQDDVEVTGATVDIGALQATREAIDYLLTGNEIEKKIEIKDGDTLWGISEATGYDIDEIVQANPGIDADMVHTGDILKLNDVEPFVHVKTTEIVTSEESIGYGTVKQKSDEIYEGQTKVKKEGSKGKKRVTLEQVKVNGDVIESDELSSEIVKEPVDEIILVGTKEMDGWYYTEGGGSLGKPLRGISISSGFGGRTHPISGTYKQHTGVDFRAPMGTPAYSSEDGTVISAGWNGGYGNLVTVNHGGGVVTYYAHLSSISVSAGERIGRGQQVGRVGSTGSSTGPHLHFEVRIDGTPRNPMRYL